MGSCVNEGLCDLLISTKLVYCLLVVGNPNTLIPSYQPHITDHFSAKMMLTGLTKTILHTLKETFSISHVFFFFILEAVNNKFQVSWREEELCKNKEDVAFVTSAVRTWAAEMGNEYAVGVDDDVDDDGDDNDDEEKVDNNFKRSGW